MLDFGGGSGLLVRLLRDNGIDAYWSDRYCQNLFARGFEYENALNLNLGLATCFEVFEHLLEPKASINEMLQICPNLLFSTELLPSPIPKHSGKDLWWYYGFSHGQHISFYERKTLAYIAKVHNLHFNSYANLHLFSQKPINPFVFKWIIKLSHKGLYTLCKRQFRSKTQSDNQALQ
ncbi:class I SAM-dependent methyltransferase [Helicobacter marmotae]|uniref:Class I SAM-dependent methyltransferase n=1 Tax=Helicobacter marmotae TaxID=152490 RepID=A0A3D8I5P0_9HELI|nr:class I SAM-dependent methyltransferase [Helicobacter marmotae]RDU60462.1 class I SAM-dependent methyltransferase [Helicobacter marmotae]